MIDAHHHLWQYSPAAYPWIDGSMSVLRRDFLVPDLRPLMAATGVTGLVTVQAQQTVDETRWLLDVAAAAPEILGVVGWVPLAEAGAAETLDDLSAHTKLRGVRHVVQSEPDDRYVLREDFNAGVSRLHALGLAYDILIYERHLPQAIAFVDRHPDQVFILDHVAKPRIREGVLSPWREQMRELAKRPRVYCKVSGMVTEADWENWSDEDLTPYVDVALEAFGARRLMFGSDWPVLNLAGSYERWVSAFRRLTSGLSADERLWIERRTAIEAYGLPVPERAS